MSDNIINNNININITITINNNILSSPVVLKINR